MAYSESKNWLFLVEAVHTSGATDAVLKVKLDELARTAKGDLVYVTAFQSRHTFRRSAADITWETEVWIADNPDHLIHFDGEKFLGPYGRPLAKAARK